MLVLMCLMNIILKSCRNHEKKQVFRNRMEDLEMWDDDEFFMRFRLKKTTVIELLSKIEFHLKSKTNR